MAEAEPKIEDVEKSITTLADSMQAYDNTTLETQELRRALVNKIMPAILKIDLNIDDSTDPDLFASTSRFIEQGRQLLNDLDSAAKNQVNIKLKKTDLEQQKQSNLEIAKLLQQVKLDSWKANDPNTPLVQNEAELAEALEHKCTEAGCVVLDTELDKEDRRLPTPDDKDDFEMKRE